MAPPAIAAASSFETTSSQQSQELEKPRTGDTHGNYNEARNSRFATSAQLAELAWWKEVSKILFNRTDVQFVKTHLSDYWIGVLNRNEDGGRASKFFTHQPLCAIVNKRHRNIVRSFQKEAYRALMKLSSTSSSSLPSSGKLDDEDDDRDENYYVVFQPFRKPEILAQVKRALQEKERQTSDDHIHNPRLPWPGQKFRKSIVFTNNNNNNSTKAHRHTTASSLVSDNAFFVDGNDEIETSPDVVATNNNMSMTRPHKQYHGIGNAVYANCSQLPDANWMKGSILDYETIDQGEFGDVRTYSVELEDDGEVFHDIHEVFVESAQDFDWRADNYSDDDDQLAKGVKEVQYVDCEDRYMRERGFYEMILDEGSVFCSIVPAMRAYDVALVRKEGSNVAPDQLNFPEEWTFDGATTPQHNVPTVMKQSDGGNVEFGVRVGNNSPAESDGDGSSCPVDTTVFSPTIIELAKICATCCESIGDSNKLPSIDWVAVYSQAHETLKTYLDSKATDEGFLETQNKLSHLVPAHIRDDYDQYFAYLYSKVPRIAGVVVDDDAYDENDDDDENDDNNRGNTWPIQGFRDNEFPPEASLLSEELLELAELLSKYKLSRKSAGGNYWIEVIAKASPRLRRLMDTTPNFYERPDKRRSLTTTRLSKPFGACVRYLKKKAAKKDETQTRIQKNNVAFSDESDNETANGVEDEYGLTDSDEEQPHIKKTLSVAKHPMATIDTNMSDDCPVDKGFFSTELLELAELLSAYNPRRKAKWADVIAKASPNLRRMMDSKENFLRRPDKCRALVEDSLRKPFSRYVKYLYRKRYVAASGNRQTIEEQEAEDEEQEAIDAPKTLPDISPLACPVNPSELSPEVRELAMLLSCNDPRVKSGPVWPHVYQQGSARLRRYLDSLEGFHDSTTKLNKAVPYNVREKFKAYREYLYDSGYHDSKTVRPSPDDNEHRAPVAMPPCPVDPKQFSPELLEIARLASSFDPRKKGGPQNQVWRHVYETGSEKLRQYLDSKAPPGVSFLRMPRKQKAMVPRHLYDDFVTYRTYLYQCQETTTSSNQEVDRDHESFGDGHGSSDEPNEADCSEDLSDCPVDTSQLPPEVVELARLVSMRNPFMTYNRDNSVWPDIMKKASPRLRRYMASLGFDLTTRDKEKVLVPFQHRESYRAYWRFLQAKRYGSSGEASTQHAKTIAQHDDANVGYQDSLQDEDTGEQQTATADDDDDYSSCSVDIAELSPELRELANLCSLRDRTVSGLGKQNFWTDVYNMASTEVKRYIDSVPGFYQSRAKRDMLVPEDVRQCFIDYQEYLVEKHRSEEGRSSTRKRRRSRTNEGMNGQDRRQRKRSTTRAEMPLELSQRVASLKGPVVSDEFEWHTSYGDKSWTFDEEANERWEVFCETVESHWADLTTLHEQDCAEGKTRWLMFGELHSALWQEFLNSEVRETLQQHNELGDLIRRSLKPSDERGSRCLRLVDRYMDRRQYRLEATLDWLHAQIEWFMGRHKSLQLARWNDFLVEVKEKCDEHRFIERGALTRHLKESRKVLHGV